MDGKICLAICGAEKYSYSKLINVFEQKMSSTLHASIDLKPAIRACVKGSFSDLKKAGSSTLVLVFSFKFFATLPMQMVVFVRITSAASPYAKGDRIRLPNAIWC